MRQIEITRTFAHADGIHPVEYPPGTYEVAEGAPGPGQVSARCAEVALANANAVEVEEAKPAGKKARRRKAAGPTGAG